MLRSALIVLGLSLSVNSYADTVIASGYGDTCEQAMAEAQKRAIDKVNGVWISAERHSRDDEYHERIDKFSGGMIKSYDILKNDCTHVIIKAEVVPRSNLVVYEGGVKLGKVVEIMKHQLDQEQAARNAFRTLNSTARAFGFEGKDVKIKPSKQEPGKIIIQIFGEMFIQPKYKADFEALIKWAEQYNNPEDMSEFYKPFVVTVTGYSNGVPIKSWKVPMRNTQLMYTHSALTSGVEFYWDQKSNIMLPIVAYPSDFVNIDDVRVRF